MGRILLQLTSCQMERHSDVSLPLGTSHLEEPQLTNKLWTACKTEQGPKPYITAVQNTVRAGIMQCKKMPEPSIFTPDVSWLSMRKVWCNWNIAMATVTSAIGLFMWDEVLTVVTLGCDTLNDLPVYTVSHPRTQELWPQQANSRHSPFAPCSLSAVCYEAEW